ncbi:MAG: 4Fe-4S dicluster domain-containing protein [Syntrophaceae bacterium]
MDVYDKLRVNLDAHPSGAPQSTHFTEILEVLFTPEEAALALHLNFSPKPLDRIADSAMMSADDAERLLESMADKAVIFSISKGGQKSYGLMATVPGLFEFPFLTRGGWPGFQKLGKLWEDYHRESFGESFAGRPTPGARVVPVERSLDSSLRVHPYEEVAKLINEVDFIALANCACRISVGACDMPLDVCLIFDSPGRFLARRKYAKEISREEAHAVLDKAEKAGLVHTSNNSADRPMFICNCCKCCCTILRGLTQLKLPTAFAVSAFQAGINSAECTNCGTCSEGRCPVGAIEIRDEVACVAADKCIGCGLCVSVCPVNAVSLVRRNVEPEIPGTAREMAVKILQEKGKLEKFLKLAQS